MLQNIVAISITLACVAFIAWQGVATLSGRKGKLGSCCAKGCDAGAKPTDKPAEAKVQFLPSSMLSKKSSAVQGKSTSVL
ncbi:hypothetical protein BH10PLA1_BH10PLA1_19570 [soil metagenome]